MDCQNARFVFSGKDKAFARPFRTPVRPETNGWCPFAYGRRGLLRTVTPAGTNARIPGRLSTKNPPVKRPAGFYWDEK
jgi:hypothetical protein